MSIGHAPSKHFYVFLFLFFFFFFFFFFSLRNVGRTWAATISDAFFSTIIKTVVIVDVNVGQTRAATFFLSSIIIYFSRIYTRCRKLRSDMGCCGFRRYVFSCILLFLLCVIA